MRLFGKTTSNKTTFSKTAMTVCIMSITVMIFSGCEGKSDCVQDATPNEVVETVAESVKPGDEMLPIADVEEAWKQIYLKKLNEIRTGRYDREIPYYGTYPSDDGYDDMLEQMVGNSYYLYDIDKDDIPELIVRFGTCQADYWGIVYTYKDSREKYVGSMSLSQCILNSDPGENGIVLQQSHMGDNRMYKMSIADGELYSEELFSESGVQSFDEYTKADQVINGSEEIFYSELKNNDLILEYRNTEY